VARRQRFGDSEIGQQAGLKDDGNKQNRRLLKSTIPSLLKLHPTLNEFLLDLLPLHWQKFKHLLYSTVENYLEWVFEA
jgi:hypothetical protein